MCLLKFVISVIPHEKALSFGRDVKRNQICRARLCGIVSRLPLSRECHYVYDHEAITARQVRVRSIFLSTRSVFRSVDELGAAEETMSSNRLPLVIRIFVAVPLIRRTKRVPNVCTCRDRCKKMGWKKSGGNQ